MYLHRSSGNHFIDFRISPIDNKVMLELSKSILYLHIIGIKTLKYFYSYCYHSILYIVNNL
jgi:hypothetical protein